MKKLGFAAVDMRFQRGGGNLPIPWGRGSGPMGQ